MVATSNDGCGVGPVWATSGTAASRRIAPRTLFRRRFDRERRRRRARRRFEVGVVRLAAERRARIERLREVARILDDRDHVQPVVAVGMCGQAVEVLGDAGLLAVGHTVLPEVSFAEAGRDDPEIAAAVDLALLARRWTTAQSATATTGNTTIQQAASGHARIRPAVGSGHPASHSGPFPLRDRETLQRAVSGGLFRAIEIQQARLCAGVEFQLQRLIVLPRNADASRLADDAADAIRLALIAARVVGVEIPARGDLAAFSAD